MAVIETWFNQDLQKPVKVQYLDGNVFSLDNSGNLVGVNVFNNGSPATLAGTVSGSVIRSDGATVAISSGTLSGNKCSIVLPQSALAVPGVISVIIKLTNSSVVTTLCAVVANVYQSSTDTTVDPGTIIPSIASLIASINAAVDSIPADYSALSTGFYESMEAEFGNTVPASWGDYTIVKSTGAMNVSTAYKTTGYLPVNGESILYTTSPAVNETVLNDRATIAFYSSQNADSFISAQPYLYGDLSMLIWQSVNVPSGAKYMRVSINGTLTDYFKCIQIQSIANYINAIPGVTSWTGSYTTLADLPDNTLCRTTNAPDRPDWQPAASGLWVLTLCNPSSTLRTQVAINSATGGMAMRFAYDASKTYSDWQGKYVTRLVETQTNISSWGGTGDAYASLADLPSNTYFRTYNAPDRPDGQTANSGFWVLTLKTYGSDLWMQYGFGAQTGVVAMRYRGSASADYSTWTFVKSEKRRIRVLFIGNSYTQDNTSYVPFIMKRLAPDIDFTFGISYYSGARIDQYIDFFDNETRVLMYSKINPEDTAWTTWGVNTSTPGPNQKTIQEILADEPWDIVTVQQGSSYMANWSTFSNLNGLIDRIISFIRSQGYRHVRLGWLMPQMRKALEESSPSYTFAAMIECVQNVVQTTPVSFVSPCGTAIQNARGTSLDNLGDNGHMTYDTNGHLQEGVPCLTGAFAATIKILELAGYPYLSVLSDNTFPNDTWLSGKNIPLAHGSAVGVTSTNTYLAQKCAIAANKFPYEVTTIV